MATENQGSNNNIASSGSSGTTDSASGYVTSNMKNPNSPERKSEGSISTSPRLTRMRTRSNSHPVGQWDEENQDSEGEKKKLKDRKGFFGGVSLLSIFSASHHQKNSELHKIFTSLPTTEKLVDDYSCALQRDILIHGRLYITQRWLCFYANIFSWETLLTIPFQSVQAITKEKTALVIPNAIQITVSSDKYGFSSLVNRDVTYNIIFKCWQNNLLDQPMTPLELVKAARKAHGESIDVGSEMDLWGEEKEDDSSVLVKQVPMPTHVEIGVIPANTAPMSFTLPRSHKQSRAPKLQECKAEDILYGSVPGGLHLTGESDVTEKPTPPSTTPESVIFSSTVPCLLNVSQTSESQAPIIPALVSTASMNTDYVDKGSLGGESAASTEYETVSLIEETGEVHCGCSEHVGRTILNDVYSCDVETLFRLLFTDSDFMRSFYKAEKTINVEMGEWQEQSDSSRLRDLTYTLALNYSFGPKFTHTSEHQNYSKSGQPGLKHIVDTEVVNHNIPYGDTFYTACQYCITRVGHNKTRLRLTATIKFKKTCWGLVKNLIERNAGDGLRTHYTHLDGVLKEHVESLPEERKRAHRRASRHSVTSSRPRHKRPVPVQTKTSSLNSIGPLLEGELSQSRDGSPREVKNGDTARSSSDISYERKSDHHLNIKKEKMDSVPRINLALTFLLGLLIFSNVLLYYHLMSYHTSKETTPLSDKLSSMGRDFPGDKEEWPSIREEWQEVIKQQLLRRDMEENQLREMLLRFIHTLDSIETSISSAKKQLLSSLSDMENNQKKSKSVLDNSFEQSKRTRGSGEL